MRAKVVVPWRKALLGVDGDGDIDDGDVEDGLWALAGGDETVCAGAGEGAWPAEIATRAKDVASMSMACVRAMPLGLMIITEES